MHAPLQPPPEKSREEIVEEWYKKLNLRDDPFKSVDGFNDIPPELYESIVVKTEYSENIYTI